MSQICVINNSLDSTDHYFIDAENVLYEFLNIRKTHPQARIYLGNPCPENDITPTSDNKESIERLANLKEDCYIVLHAGDIITAVTAIASILIGALVTYLIPTPSINIGNQSQATGSSNNNLGNIENKSRIKERIPYIIGRVKAIPDLYAPPYRHFKEGVEVEELLLCISENPVQVSNFKSGDTPIEEITGMSVSAYGHNQSLTGIDTIYKIGDDFTEAPVIAKQNASINGQTLLPPNSTRVERNDIYFVYPNQIKTLNSTSDLEKFTVSENVIIDGANYGIADIAFSGSIDLDYTAYTLSLTSASTLVDYQDYRKINITALLVTDPANGLQDLAGLYDVTSVTYVGGVYTVTLTNPTSTNANWSNLTANATENISANLTANTNNIFLDGEYTITGIDTANKLMTLATPSTVNSDWNKLQDLTGQQTPTGNIIKLRGSQQNYIGWFTIDSQNATGLLLNFKALNGIYQGSKAKTVSIYVEYQQVASGTPTGTVYNDTITLTGKANNRDSVGGSMWINLPFSGAVRFRARRSNDNGDAADLVDETKFYSAYAYHYLSKLIYDNRVLVRSRTVATQNATSQQSRQLNCIAESLVYSYVGGVKSASRIASRNIADLTIDLALHPKIGRRAESEIDFDRIYQAVSDIDAYFGSSKLTEFNYTLDNTNTSFEELMRMMSYATCSNERRVNRKIYYELESVDNEPTILFNHRNKEPKSESRGYSFVTKNDGVELTYVDSENGWVEKILRIPNDQIKNPKKTDGRGIVYTEQAHIVAWREWNKIKFGRILSTFKAYCESDLVFRGNCVLNADDTRPEDSMNGEIVAWSGTTIVCSQPFSVTTGYVIHLQLKSRNIDVIPITQGADLFSYNLSRPPIEALVTTGEVRTAYTITTVSNSTNQRFLVSEKRPLDIFENELTITNFDERFYRNDKDIINAII